VDVSYVYRFDQENVPVMDSEIAWAISWIRRKGSAWARSPASKATSAPLAFQGFEFGATVYYIDSYLDDTAAVGYTRSVDSIITLDLQASYTIQNSPHGWLNSTKFTVGCINVTDEQPPLVVAAFADNYDRDTHDLRQRFVYVALSKKF